MNDFEQFYDGREQTLVKHSVLKRYLQRFAYIIGSRWNSITYVDCFSGPWNERSSTFSDTSFAIAIEQLRTARQQLAKDFRIRCFFIERDPVAYSKLKEFTESIADIEIQTHNAKFEDSIGEILRFVHADKRTFPFFLIDPKGWSIPLETIAPLLRLDQGEVLITFMLEFIRRFIGHPDESIRESFDGLFGERGIASQFEGVLGEERDDLLLSEYMRVVQAAGGFEFASSSLVLHPDKSRRHFNLVYLTRHHKGVEVFKEAEKRAMIDMENARAKAAQRQRTSGGQLDLFSAEELHNNEYFDGLRNRYLDKMRKLLLEHLRLNGSIGFDEAWSSSLRSPLIWQTDLKELLAELEKLGTIRLEGLEPGSRVPKLGQNVRIASKPKF